MAVEIPVYIDIKGAIDAAAKDVPSGIKNLQSIVSKNALKLEFDVGTTKMRLEEMLLGPNTTMPELKRGLRSIREEFDRISQAAAKNAKADPGLQKTKALANAYALVEQRITGVSNSTKAATMMVEHNITKVRIKIDELRNKLSTLSTGTDVWRKTNYEIQLQEQKLAQLNGQLRAYHMATTDANSALSTQGRLLGQVNGLLSTYISAFGLLRFVKQIRDVTAELEYQRIALGHLIQDEEYGNKLFEQIKQNALESPFRIKDLVTYTKQLAAYQIEEENLIDTTKMLADISAGLGVDMNRLILAFGQVRAASVLRGQELRQFTEAGIPLVDLLAKKFRELGREGTTTADVFKLISERAVPFSMIAEIFEDLTSKGGMFYDMQKIQVETLKGSWEKLKDTFDIALQSIGETKSFERGNKLILNTLSVLANNIRIIPKLMSALTRGWLLYKAAILVTNKSVKQAISYEVALAASRKADAARIGDVTLKVLGEAKARDLLTKAYAKQAVATNVLTKSFWKLTAAMLSNPIGMAIAGIGALSGLIFSFRNRTEEAASSTEQYQEAVENLAKAQQNFAKSKKLIEKYENLSKKTERTAAENKELRNTMDRLVDIYPEITTQIDKENDSLDDQIQKLNEIRGLNSKKAEEATMDSYRVAKKDLEEALQKQDELQASYDRAMALEKRFDEEHNKSQEKRWRKNAQKQKEQLEQQKKNTEALYTVVAKMEEKLFPEKANVNLAGWRQQLSDLQEEKVALGASPIFTPNEVQELESVYDLFKKLKKEWEDATESLEGMQEAYDQMEEGATKVELGGELTELRAKIQLIEAMRDLFGFDFSKKTSGGTAYTQDPFIQTMQERIKFMQDFKKGYEDLNKYMNKSAAMDKQATNMLARGLSLGIDAAEQKMAAEQLIDWYETAIKDAFAKAQQYGAGTNVTTFLSQQITGSSNKAKALRDFQKLIQSLYDAQTDLKTDKLRKTLEDNFKRLTDEVKRSETVRNFYQNIFDLTGDHQLATSLSMDIYGGIGDDFKDRLQTQLNAALDALEPDKITDTLRQAFAEKNFEEILKNIDIFPEKWQEMLKQMAQDNEQFNANLAKDLIQSLQKAKTYSEKRVELALQTARRMEQISSMDVSEETKAGLRKQNARKEAEEAAKLAYEAFKDTPMYVELFANLDEASSKMLTNMRDNLIAMKSQWKDLTPTELKELQSRIEELDQQIAQRNPFKALMDSIREYRDLTAQKSRQEAEIDAIAADQRLKAERDLLEEKTKAYELARQEHAINSEEVKVAKIEMDRQAKITDEAQEQAEAAQEEASAFRVAAHHITVAADKLQEWTGYISEALGGIGQIVETFGSADTADAFSIISDGIGKTLGGVAKTGTGVARVMAGDFSGVAQIVSGIGDFIGGVFGTANALKMRHINEQIEDQDDILHNLERSYNQLEKAMANALGSDYIKNYNQQLDILAAKQAAYERQAQLEAEKGKKADEEKIKEYKESAEEAMLDIKDMEGKLAEYFAGSDVASAARDFANSWIEAYRSFGSTTMAMREKFREMLDNMVTESLAAKMIQEILNPIFKNIEDYAKDGELTEMEIGDIAAKTEAATQEINNAMTALMQRLTAAGINMRGAVGGFSGISKDIAGASEQSINGLAAGINTQNYYMSYMPAISADVALIRAAIVGEVAPTAGPSRMGTAVGVESQFGDELFRGQMNRLDVNIAEIRNLLASVVSLPNTPTNTKVIAAKI